MSAPSPSPAVALLWAVQAAHEAIAAQLAAVDRELGSGERASHGAAHLQTPPKPKPPRPAGDIPARVLSVLAITRRNLNLQLIEERKVLRSYALRCGVADADLPPSFGPSCKFVPSPGRGPPVDAPPPSDSKPMRPAAGTTPAKSDPDLHLKVLVSLRQRLTAELSSLLLYPIGSDDVITAHHVADPALLPRAAGLLADVTRITRELSTLLAMGRIEAKATPAGPLITPSSAPSTSPSPLHSPARADTQSHGGAVRKLFVSPVALPLPPLLPPPLLAAPAPAPLPAPVAAAPPAPFRRPAPAPSPSPAAAPVAAPLGETSRSALASVKERLAALVPPRAHDTPRASSPAPSPSPSPSPQPGAASAGPNVPRPSQSLYDPARVSPLPPVAAVSPPPPSLASTGGGGPSLDRTITKLLHGFTGVPFLSADEARLARAAAAAPPSPPSPMEEAQDCESDVSDYDIIQNDMMHARAALASCMAEADVVNNVTVNRQDFELPEEEEEEVEEGGDGEERDGKYDDDDDGDGGGGMMAHRAGRPVVVVPDVPLAVTHSVPGRPVPVVAYPPSSPAPVESPPPIPRARTRLFPHSPFRSGGAEFHTPTRHPLANAVRVQSPLSLSPLDQDGDPSAFYLDVNQSFTTTPGREADPRRPL